jgi:hypothetical protein
VNDVITLHKHYPDDWKTSWQELQSKWGYDHFCGSGETFNIDAKVNGAFIVMGLLYGSGDPLKTLEITTRCGQDSDCNPSNAMAVLGVIIGFDKLPQDMQVGVNYMADSLFINTNYSFKKAVENTFNYCIKLISENGGKIGKTEVTIKKQMPTAPELEVSFPNIILEKKISVFDRTAWKFTGKWKTYQRIGWPDEKPYDQAIFSGNPGDVLEISFSGSGISIDGNWFKDGGNADVYLDGKLMRTIDTFYNYNKQEHENITIWHVTGLTSSTHKVKIVVKGEKKPESLGTNIYITKAIIYQTGKKHSDSSKLSFDK